MPKRRFLFLLFLLHASLVRVSAQTSAGFEVVSTAQGLSQGLINDMLQDREGFIWIATKGGLNRYDGYTFKIFTTDPQDVNSISSNSVSNLMEDSKGRIWIGTYDGGVNVYDKKTGRFSRIYKKAGDANGLSGNRIVSAMIELADGRVLVCPQGARMNIISISAEANSTPLITHLDAPGNREILGIGKDDKGFIWAGCMDKSLFIFNPSSESFDMLSDGVTLTGLVEHVGTRISVRSSQTFILEIAPFAVIKLVDSTARMYPGAISYSAARGMLLDSRLPIQPGAAGSLFYDFSSLKKGSALKDMKGYSLADIGNDQTIKCILLDRSGVLWLGMLGNGLYKYRIGSDRFNPILPKLSIQRLTILNKDIIYVHGWSNVRSITAEGLAAVNPLASVVGNSAGTNVLQASNGDYWTYNLQEKKVRRYTADLKLSATYPEPVNPTPTEQLQPMIEDRKQRIWVCGANGTLARIDPVTRKLSPFVINIEKSSGGSSLVQTTAFYQDAAGVYWMGTEHGFARLAFTNDTTAPEVKWFRNIPGNSNSLSYNYVAWFMDDPVDADYLWISTKGGGLDRLQKSTGNFIHYTTRQGLPNDVVYGTLIDKAGNLWGSTNRGLFCMLSANKKENGEPVVRVFGTSDGLQADEFNTNAFGKLSNGDLVFGGVNGVNIFNPEKILTTSFRPEVFITGIIIGNKSLAPGDNSHVLKNTIEQTQSITLGYLQDVLTLEFSSLDFTAPQQNKYRYQLVGIDKEWIESGTRRTATYLHLPSGSYIFKVQGSNSQGIWSDQIAQLKIKVLPPWWLSWWAYIIYALLIALGIRAYLNFNINKEKLQSQLNYQHLEAKKVKELDIVKTQLYTNITHEFRTPLTVILGMAQQVIEKPTVQFETRMDMIVRNGRSLLNLVNQMLDLSKLETGKMQLQLSTGNIIHFLGYVVESFHSLAESQQKQLHFLTDVEAVYVEYDKEKLRQIISNLLSNAIKFTPQKGNIYISVTEMVPSVPDNENSTLLIKVKDTGIGIAEDQLQFVFDRFYQLDNSDTNTAGGTGIGLALTKELIRLMGGEIAVKSQLAGANKGSEFIVSLPLKKVPEVEEAMLDGFKKRSVVPGIVEVNPATPVITDEVNKNAPLILLVEDNEDVVAYTASCLPEYRLVVGADGREGLDIATEMIPDLIITDVMMPFMDGFELTNKLRSNTGTSHIPVIMLTAKADIASKIEGLQQGADAYLEKPFNKNELLVRIKKLLEMRKSLQQYYLRQAGIHPEVPVNPLMVPDKTNGDTIEDSFVKRVREAIEKNLADANFTVEQLSKLVFMSHSQMHRKLDALTGCSPNKFIRMIRLEKAKQLLKDPTNSISSVAMECGYDDPGYFARVFKQEYDVTPQKWRISIKL